jgi:hypothetical protein
VPNILEVCCKIPSIKKVSAAADPTDRSTEPAAAVALSRRRSGERDL